MRWTRRGGGRFQEEAAAPASVEVGENGGFWSEKSRSD